MVWRGTSSLASLRDAVMLLVLDFLKVDLASAATPPVNSPGCYKIERISPNLELREEVHIVGTIQDQRSAPFQNSRVELREYVSQRKQTSVLAVSTDDHGRFDLGLVQPGKYRLLASPHRGFEQPSALDCQSGKNCELNITLIANPIERVFSSCPIR